MKSVRYDVKKETFKMIGIMAAEKYGQLKENGPKYHRVYRRPKTIDFSRVLKSMTTFIYTVLQKNEKMKS